MSSLFNFPWQQAFDSSGNTLAGAKLYFYEAGTSTPQNVYSDISLETPLPFPVVANGAGRFPPIYMQDVAYKIALFTEKDELIWTADDVYINTNTADSYFAKTAIDDATISAGYTEEEAKDPTNFAKALFKYASASCWYNEVGENANEYILSGFNNYSKPEDYFAGMQVWFYTSRTNTGAATINVDSLGAKNIVNPNGTTITAGSIFGMIHLVYNGTAFIVMESDSAKYPIGSIYSTKTNENPSNILGFGTWELITSSVVIPSGKVKVYGNGKTLGMTDGTNNFGVVGQVYTDSKLNAFTGGYDKNAGATGLNTGSSVTAGVGYGIVKSGESGIEVNMANATSVTIYIWERTA